MINVKTYNNLRALVKIYRNANPNNDLQFIAYKYVMKVTRSSPVYRHSTNHPIYYKKGKIKVIATRKCDFNTRQSCGAGINVATRAWARRYASSIHEVIQLKIKLKDVVAFPVNYNGRLLHKFRVRRVEVIS